MNQGDVHFPLIFFGVGKREQSRARTMQDTTDPQHWTLAEKQDQARGQTLALVQIAAGHFRVSIPRPAIRFDLRGKSAGQARTGGGKGPLIRYNRILLMRHTEEFLQRTVPHEVAHLVAFRLCGTGIRPHGPEWGAIMKLFGAAPERCHSYDVEDLQTRRLRRYLYRCACRAHELTSIRHNRIEAGQVYHCRSCGQALTRAADGG